MRQAEYSAKHQVFCCRRDRVGCCLCVILSLGVHSLTVSLIVVFATKSVPFCCICPVVRLFPCPCFSLPHRYLSCPRPFFPARTVALSSGAGCRKIRERGPGAAALSRRTHPLNRHPGQVVTPPATGRVSSSDVTNLTRHGGMHIAQGHDRTAKGQDERRMKAGNRCHFWRRAGGK